MTKPTFLYSRAQSEADLLQKYLLQGPCDKVEICGSLRRLRPEVHDIDLVATLKQGFLLDAMQIYATLGPDWKWEMGGAKLVRGTWRGIPVDIYFADESSWWTLFLVKTGSKPHNIRLADLAKKKGWHLHADGGGLTDGDGKRLAGESEESFFTALGIPFLEPKDREVGHW